MPRISEMYAFVVSDSEPDDEGIVAELVGDQWVPFVGADLQRVASLQPSAQRMADAIGKQIRVVKFPGPPEVIRTISPASANGHG